jgi:hypothetical protein
MATLSRRYLALCGAAASHPAWGQQWGGYKPGSFGTLLAFQDARQARLALLIERGWQGSYSMSTVLKMTDARWAAALQKLARQGGVPSVQQLQHGQVRLRQWVRGQHCGALTPCISLLYGRQLQTRAQLCLRQRPPALCAPQAAAAAEEPPAEGQEGRRAQQADSLDGGRGAAAGSGG